MASDTNTTADQILSYAASRPEGSTLSARELLQFGERAAVDQALSRLAKRGQLLRVARGLYTLPVKTRFGERPPEPETVLDAIIRRTGEIITTSGAAAANRLGLTAQIPVRTVYLTSGRSRRLKLGGRTIELHHAPAWQLRAPASRAGDALRALAWLGPTAVEQKVKALRAELTEEEQAELSALRGQAPTWLARELSALAAHG